MSTNHGQLTAVIDARIDDLHRLILSEPFSYVGKRVVKFFEKHGWFYGTVVDYVPPASSLDTTECLFEIRYDDGDEEDYSALDLAQRLLSHADIYRASNSTGIYQEQSDTIANTSEFEKPDAFVGERVAKYFDGYGWYHGTVKRKMEGGIYKIRYDDEDREDCDGSEVRDLIRQYKCPPKGTRKRKSKPVCKNRA